MADFEQAVAMVLKHEGGFVDDPDDKGGMTNFGITEYTYKDYFKGPMPSHQQMMDLTIDEAKKIYKQYYWDPFDFDFELDQKYATIVLNMAVLRGVSAIKQILPNNALNVVLNSQIAFINIVKRDSSQIKFLLGWINRTHELLRYLND